MKGFLAEGGSERLVEAVRAVESRSAAEVVVTVRPWSGEPRLLDLSWAILSAGLASAVVILGPWPFSTLALFLDPLAAGVIAFLLSRSLPPMRRLLLRRVAAERTVQAAASALFHEKRIHQTRARSGLLVHVSLLERMVHVVADLGVEDSVDEELWQDRLADLAVSLRQGGGVQSVAASIEGLADVLEEALPRSADDVNELPDEPCA